MSPKKSFKGHDLSIPGAGKSLFLNHPYDFPVIGLSGTAAILPPAGSAADPRTSRTHQREKSGKFQKTSVYPLLLCYNFHLLL